LESVFVVEVSENISELDLCEVVANANLVTFEVLCDQEIFSLVLFLVVTANQEIFFQVSVLGEIFYLVTF